MMISVQMEPTDVAKREKSSEVSAALAEEERKDVLAQVLPAIHRGGCDRGVTSSDTEKSISSYKTDGRAKWKEKEAFLHLPN